MAIIPLPQATIHLLGSAQALTTPLSLVKELVDNALDAKATSIDVNVSQNTLDKIEVRDNGHGIPLEDLDALGRRGHTSKLRSFEELKSVGGISLGFRGEALASAVQLGEVSVTTKTDGEPVAACVKLQAPGGVASQTRTSHPVGTTVCVKNFISNIPVRKQTALKAAPKTLVKIKELLQSYALARPTIRFSLKVAKEAKGSWSFSPRQNDGIREAVSQVIGRDATVECIEKSLVFPESSSINSSSPFIQPTTGSNRQGSQLKEYQFIVDVFLPKPEANPAKIGHGQFLSIDSRPVSHEKGTMRKIVTLFKYYVKDSLTEKSEKIKSPFLRLNIKCPVASYDPNVEPAKDDVLFSNEHLVLESIENLFKNIYGEPKPTPAVTLEQPLSTKMDNFELLLTREPVKQPTINQPEVPQEGIEFTSLPTTSARSHSPERSNQIDPTREEENIASSIEDDDGYGDAHLHNRTSKWGFDMSKDFSEETEGPRLSNHTKKFRPPGPARNSDQQLEITRTNDLNPWVIAKVNAPVRRSGTPTGITTRANHEDKQQPKSNSPSISRRSSDPSLLESDNQNWLAGATRRRRMSNPDDSMSAYPDMQQPALPHCETSDNLHLGTRLHRRSRTVDNDEEILFGGDENLFACGNDFISARHALEAGLISPPLTQRQDVLKRTRGFKKLFVSPPKTVENPAPQGVLRQTTLQAVNQIPRSQRDLCQNDLQEEGQADLAWAMDFEQRKEEATRQYRQKIKAARLQAETEFADAGRGTDVLQPSPDKNRYYAAIASLEEGQGFEADNGVVNEPFKTTLPDGDPRAYLMRRRRSMSVQPSKPGEPPRPMRTKSARLPLEKIPETEQLHTLVLTIPTDIDSIRRAVVALVNEDTYVQSGNQTRGLLMNVADSPEVIRRIQVAAVKWTSTEKGKNYEFEYNFANLLRTMQ